MSRGIVGKLQGKVLDNLKKSKKPLDNSLPLWYNDNVKRGYTPFETDRHQLQNGKQIGREWKVKPKIFSKTLKKHLTRLVQCAIIKVQGKGIPELGGQEKISKKIEKPLDKIKSLCYNKYVKKRKELILWKK